MYRSALSSRDLIAESRANLNCRTLLDTAVEPRYDNRLMREDLAQEELGTAD